MHICFTFEYISFDLFIIYINMIWNITKGKTKSMFIMDLLLFSYYQYNLKYDKIQEFPSSTKLHRKYDT